MLYLVPLMSELIGVALSCDDHMGENLSGGVLWQSYCVQEKNYEAWDDSIAEKIANREGIEYVSKNKKELLNICDSMPANMKISQFQTVFVSIPNNEKSVLIFNLPIQKSVENRWIT